MKEREIIEQVVDYVKEKLQGAEAGHDWFHVERVWKLSRTIAKGEQGVNTLVIDLGALLHDIADAKFHNGDEGIGPKTARDFLEKMNVEEEVIEHVVNIIQNISFGGGNYEQKFKSAELDIVQDADRLDAIGAIGIARTFNYGGARGRLLYDPEKKPKLNMTKEEYRKNNSSTLNHFYEKLLLLKDRMNTETGKNMAIKRHEYMEGYLSQFLGEWEGTR